jgi:hypothetical protein
MGFGRSDVECSLWGGGRLGRLGREGEPVRSYFAQNFFSFTSRNGFVARWSRAMFVGFRV